MRAQNRPVVVCVSYPLAYFAERLAGDLAEVRFPVPPGVDPSFWRPSVAEISAIQAADLIVLNGADFATWTTRTTLPRARTLDTSAGFADAYFATETITHSHGADGEHSHTGTASYTWLDFAQATLQAQAIATALGRILPEAKAQIATNLAALSDDLALLDSTARQVGAQADGMAIIASHPRYQYFGRAYGINLSYLQWDAREPATEDQWGALSQGIAETEAQLFLWEAEPDRGALDRMTDLGLVNAVFPPLANRPEIGDFVTAMTASLKALGSALGEASSG